MPFASVALAGRSSGVEMTKVYVPELSTAVSASVAHSVTGYGLRHSLVHIDQ